MGQQLATQRRGSCLVVATAIRPDSYLLLRDFIIQHLSGIHYQFISRVSRASVMLLCTRRRRAVCVCVLLNRHHTKYYQQLLLFKHKAGVGANKSNRPFIDTGHCVVFHLDLLCFLRSTNKSQMNMAHPIFKFIIQVQGIPLNADCYYLKQMHSRHRHLLTCSNSTTGTGFEQISPETFQLALSCTRVRYNPLARIVH